MLVRHRVTHRVLTSSWSKTRVLVEVTQSDRCFGHFYFWVNSLGRKASAYVDGASLRLGPRRRL
jgi:hypothetical protein